MATHITYCRNCAAMCGLEVTTESGKVIDIRGDQDHAISAGYFCIKGMATRSFHNGEDRLLNSLRRNAQGGYDPVDNGVALDEIHEKLSDIIARYGPESVAVYYGTGANCNALSVPAAKAWASAVGTPYIFSSMTLDQSGKWVTASRMGMFATGKHQAPDIDALMIVGSNPAASHASFGLPDSNGTKQARMARQAGMKLIVVDPRKTEIARNADLHLPVRPGEDATLFAGFIRMVFDKGLVDQAFCDRFTQSLDVLRDAVDDFTVDYVSDRTGISVDALEEAITLFTSAKRASVASGTGPSMSLNSNLAEHLIEAFNAICGGYRRAVSTTASFDHFLSV